MYITIVNKGEDMDLKESKMDNMGGCGVGIHVGTR